MIKERWNTYLCIVEMFAGGDLICRVLFTTHTPRVNCFLTHLRLPSMACGGVYYLRIPRGVYFSGAKGGTATNRDIRKQGPEAKVVSDLLDSRAGLVAKELLKRCAIA